MPLYQKMEFDDMCILFDKYQRVTDGQMCHNNMHGMLTSDYFNRSLASE